MLDNLDTIFDFSLGNIGSHQDLPLNYIYSAKIACSTVKATLLKDDSEPHGPFEIKFCKGKSSFNKPFFVSQEIHIKELYQVISIRSLLEKIQ